MNVPNFFIRRPVVAVVMSAVIVILGALSALVLPLSEYPAVVPPTVSVTANYPGADAETVAESVAGPIEQAINGVEGMLYMSSQSTGDGAMRLTVTFAQGTDPDRAQVQVQNRVDRVLAKLPVEVQRLGVVTEKVSPDFTLVAHLVSEDLSRDPLYLSNFANLRVKDALARLEGVGAVQVFGAGDYAMRIWLDPERIAARGLSAADIVRAVQDENALIAAGSVGSQPDATAAFEIQVTAGGRLEDEEAFGRIVVATGADGQVVRLSDVARIELGGNSYRLRSLLDGKPAVALAVSQTPGANALDVSSRVRTALEALQAEFPPGVSWRIAYDPTIFVRASISAVLTTLLEAIGLVVLVVVLFLQSWRAALIPLVAVPVSVFGTLAVMHVAGFSLNTLSLFGLVLSIGIVVDDAIVVVENVERHLARKLRAAEAARVAMAEVTSPIVAITAVLCAVFVPTAFLTGLTGQFYSQFALTIAISTAISALSSLTLSPALAAVILKGHDERPDLATRLLNRVAGPGFRLFNRGFEAAGRGYVRLVARTLRAGTVVLVAYIALIGLTWKSFETVPGGFVPPQDKYYLVAIAQLPAAASLDRTEAVVERMTDIMLEEPGVESVAAFPGLSINGFVTSSSSAVLFAMLDPFEARATPDLSAGAIAGRLNQKFAGIGEAFAAVFPPPPVPGLGVTGGFKIEVEDRSGAGPAALHQVSQAFVAEVSQIPGVVGAMSGLDINVPRLSLSIDRVRAEMLGLDLSDVSRTLQVYLGSLYVNDFDRFGRTWPVTVQADAPFRMSPEQIGTLKVRNRTGEMVPLSAVVTITESAGPERIQRYNGFLAAEVTGIILPGFGQDAVVDAVEDAARRVLPPGFTVEWTDLVQQQKLAGDTSALVFPLAVLFAFLILAAQFDGWRLPVSVLAAVPLSLLSALAGVWLTGGANDIFTQIGLIVLIGLAAKNAILIVEFARARELAEGMSPEAAVLEACRLRLRPVLMTSIAFIAGAWPLAAATGAGAEMRHAMGVAVFSGMIGVTLFGLVFTPIAYVAVRRLGRRGKPVAAEGAGAAEAP